MTSGHRRRGRAARWGAALLVAWLSAGLSAGPGLTAEKAAAPSQKNSDKPIEITADSLEVHQQEGVAIFAGNVDSVQGDMRLRADSLEVYYRTDGKDSSAMLAQGAISRMHAKGQVFVSSPTETAQGDEGVYDVVNKTITLTGKVILTRGENVVRGTRLVLDLETGVSRIEGQVGASGKKHRVKGLFVPKKGQ